MTASERAVWKAGGPEDLDLNLEDFVNHVNAELVNKIANLVSRVMPFVTGMLLAAGPDSADVVVAEFARPRQPGERVR